MESDVYNSDNRKIKYSKDDPITQPVKTKASAKLSKYPFLFITFREACRMRVIHTNSELSRRDNCEFVSREQKEENVPSLKKNNYWKDRTNQDVDVHMDKRKRKRNIEDETSNRTPTNEENREGNEESILSCLGVNKTELVAENLKKKKKTLTVGGKSILEKKSSFDNNRKKLEKRRENILKDSQALENEDLDQNCNEENLSLLKNDGQANDIFDKLNHNGLVKNQKGDRLLRSEEKEEIVLSSINTRKSTQIQEDKVEKSNEEKSSSLKIMNGEDLNILGNLYCEEHPMKSHKANITPLIKYSRNSKKTRKSEENSEHPQKKSDDVNISDNLNVHISFTREKRIRCQNEKRDEESMLLPIGQMNEEKVCHLTELEENCILYFLANKKSEEKVNYGDDFHTKKRNNIVIEEKTSSVQEQICQVDITEDNSVRSSKDLKNDNKKRNSENTGMKIQIEDTSKPIEENIEKGFLRRRKKSEDVNISNNLTTHISFTSEEKEEHFPIDKRNKESKSVSDGEDSLLNEEMSVGSVQEQRCQVDINEEISVRFLNDLKNYIKKRRNAENTGVKIQIEDTSKQIEENIEKGFLRRRKKSEDVNISNNLTTHISFTPEEREEYFPIDNKNKESKSVSASEDSLHMMKHMKIGNEEMSVGTVQGQRCQVDINEENSVRLSTDLKNCNKKRRNAENTGMKIQIKDTSKPIEENVEKGFLRRRKKSEDVNISNNLTTHISFTPEEKEEHLPNDKRNKESKSVSDGEDSLLNEEMSVGTVQEQRCQVDINEENSVRLSNDLKNCIKKRRNAKNTGMKIQIEDTSKQIEENVEKGFLRRRKKSEDVNIFNNLTTHILFTPEEKEEYFPIDKKNKESKSVSAGADSLHRKKHMKIVNEEISVGTVQEQKDQTKTIEENSEEVHLSLQKKSEDVSISDILFTCKEKEKHLIDKRNEESIPLIRKVQVCPITGELEENCPLSFLTDRHGEVKVIGGDFHLKKHTSIINEEKTASTVQEQKDKTESIEENGLTFLPKKYNKKRIIRESSVTSTENIDTTRGESVNICDNLSTHIRFRREKKKRSSNDKINEENKGGENDAVSSLTKRKSVEEPEDQTEIEEVVRDVSSRKHAHICKKKTVDVESTVMNIQIQEKLTSYNEENEEKSLHLRKNNEELNTHNLIQRQEDETSINEEVCSLPSKEINEERQQRNHEDYLQEETEDEQGGVFGEKESQSNEVSLLIRAENEESNLLLIGEQAKHQNRCEEMINTYDDVNNDMGLHMKQNQEKKKSENCIEIQHQDRIELNEINSEESSLSLRMTSCEEEVNTCNDVNLKKLQEKKNEENLLHIDTFEANSLDQSNNVSSLEVVDPLIEEGPIVENNIDQSKNVAVSDNEETEESSEETSETEESSEETSTEESSDEDENGLSKDTIKKLKTLSIKIPWEVPKLHTIETRISTVPKPEQREEIKKLKIQIKSGIFNKAEDEQIKSNWEEFCRLHDLPQDPTPFTDFSCGKDSLLLPTLERIKFVRFLAHGLDNRFLNSVYTRFKKLFSNKDIKSGRFTEEEDNIIKKFMEKTTSTTPYFELAKILNRDRASVYRRTKKLNCEVIDQHVRWNKKKIKKFLKYCLKITHNSKIDDLKDKQFSQKEWLQLSKKMKIPVCKLQYAWSGTIHPRVFIKKSVNLKRIKSGIIEILTDKEEDDWRNIKWGEIAEDFEGFTSYKLNTLVKRMVKVHVPEEKRKNLKDCLEYFKEFNAEKRFRTRVLEKLQVDEKVLTNKNKE